MISQLFVLTPRGDTIVNKDYRGDVARGTNEIFFRKVTAWEGTAPPVFSIANVHFFHVIRGNLYFVATTKFNVSPVAVLELLSRVAAVVKDYCGVLSEEALRVNFVLVYELLDELIDFGYAQTTSTEALKAHVRKQAIEIGHQRHARALGQLQSQTRMPSSAANKSVAGARQNRSNNELFLDMLERLTVLFSHSGSVVRCEVDGTIQMKSFLQGSPVIIMGLNEDLVIGRGQHGLALDDCNFHESVNLDDFETQRILRIQPPEGEFAAMRYRITADAEPLRNPLPFRTSVAIEDLQQGGRIDVLIKLDALMPAKASTTSLTVQIPLPKKTSSCVHELSAHGHKFAYDADQKVGKWTISKLAGHSSCHVRIRLTVSETDSRTVHKEIGPVSLQFELPLYVCSGMNIRFLKAADRGQILNPMRWVRYITFSDSYVFRV